MAKRRHQKKTPLTEPRDTNQNLKLTFGIGCVAFLVYANALGNGLVYDDHFIIERNDIVRNLDVWRVFTTHYWGGYEGNETGQYRPLTILSFLFDAVGGINPFRFHLSNVLLHSFNSVLAFVLCRQAGLTTIGAVFAGLLFAVHPIHAEVVAGVSFGRPDLLAAWGVLSTLVCYIRSHQTTDVRLYAVALVTFLLGLLSKESALTVLGPIVIYDLYIGNTFLQTVRTRFFYWLGFLGVFFGYLWLRGFAAGLGFEAGSMSELNNPLVGHALDVRLYTSAALFWKYVAIIVWPAVLSVDYSYDAIPVVFSPFHMSTFLGFLFGISGIVGWLWAGKKGKKAFFLGALFWAPYAAVSQSLILINAMFQERFMYLPVLGVFMVLALGVEYFWHRYKEATLVVCVLLVAGFSGRTWQRNKDWKSDYTLYQSAVIAYPRSAKMQHALADELAQMGRFSASEAAYRRALRIREDVLSWNNLGNLLAAQERYQAAINAYQQAVAHDKNYTQAWTNWGMTAMRAGLIDKAKMAFENAVKLDPKNADVHYHLGVACAEVGDFEKATQSYARAVLLRPSWAEAHFNLANAYRDDGQKEEALISYRQFLKLWRGDHQITQLAQQEIKRLEQ